MKSMKTRTDFKNLSFKKKLQYIWDYYKLIIAVCILVIYALCYFAFRHFTYSEPELYAAYVNLVMGSETETNIITNSPIKLQAYTNLVLTDNTDSLDYSYAYASQAKILASIDSEQLDVVIANEEAFAAFAQNGYLCNIEDYLSVASPDLASKLQEYYVSNVDLSTEAILEYPMGLDLSCSKYIQDAEFPEKVYLAVIANSNRRDAALRYIEYLTES